MCVVVPGEAAAGRLLAEHTVAQLHYKVTWLFALFTVLVDNCFAHAPTVYSQRQAATEYVSVHSAASRPPLVQQCLHVERAC
jgi:hypothetical protein